MKPWSLVLGGLAVAVSMTAGSPAFAKSSLPGSDASQQALREAWRQELATRLGRPYTRSALPATSHATASIQGAADSSVENVWTMCPAPAQRSRHAVVYDPVRDQMIMLGGEDWWARIDYADAWSLTLDGEPAWTQLVPEGPTPESISGHSAVYDPVGDRVLVFGGGLELWQLTLTEPVAWSALTAAGTPPSARRGHSAVIDPARNRMIVFGGWNGARLQDTWELNLDGTPTWSELAPAGGPPPIRDEHTAIVDPSNDRMIVYGGWNDRDDVWELSLGDTPTWTQLAPSGVAPPGRWAHVAVFDPAQDRMVVFGGESAGPTANTWALSLDVAPTWTALAPSGPLPMARYSHAATLDPIRNRLIACGGEQWDDLPIRDVWALSLEATPSWAELAPDGAAPAGRSAATAILDPLRDRMVVFGGENGGYLNDGGATNPTTSAVHSRWLGPANSWTQEVTTGDSPSARMDHGVIHDPLRDRMIVFGGAASRFAGGSSDLWALALSDMSWTPVAPSGVVPGPLRGHSSTYDPVRDRMIVFGGAASSSGAAENAVWVLSLDGLPEWTALTVGGVAPASRRGHVALYDANADRLLVFGGRSSAGEALDDVWTLSLGETPEWTQLAPSGDLPAGRWGHAAVADAAHDRIVVQGGLTNTGPTDEVWSLTLGESPSWALLSLPVAPHARSEHVAVLDPTRERMVVFGGWDGEFVLRNDFWTLTWTDPPSAAVPGPRRPVLLGARPNPFRAGGQIAFELTRPADITLEVFDVRGRRVDTIARGMRAAGRHEISWAASGIAPGVYFLNLVGDVAPVRQRMVVVR